MKQSMRAGPIFNFLSAGSLWDGADYVYRVNDDTEMRTLWVKTLPPILTTGVPRS